MTPIHADLQATLDAVKVVSPTRYTFLGEPRDAAAVAQGPNRGPDDLGAEGGDERVDGLVDSIAVDLYERLYLRPEAAPPPLPADQFNRRDLVAALRAANSGRGTWESGWSVRRVEGDGQRIAVVRERLTFWVSPEGLRVPGGEVRAGAACQVRVGKEMRNWVPGFYVALGDAGTDLDDPGGHAGPLIRYYWHLMPEAAAPFMKEATSVLNKAGVPFVIKVRNDPNGFRRADAGVLFVRRWYLALLGDAVTRVHALVAAGLRHEVPLFTLRLGDGLGLAEDPEGELSFGQHRCLLAARALCRSFRKGDTDTMGRAFTMAETFLQAGLDPTRPHLGPDAQC